MRPQQGYELLWWRDDPAQVSGQHAAAARPHIPPRADSEQRKQRCGAVSVVRVREEIPQMARRGVKPGSSSDGSWSPFQAG